MLEQDFDIGSDVWSVTSFTELRREGLECERWNRHHPQATPKVSYVSACLNERSGPVIAATDYMKAYADQIRCFVPGVTPCSAPTVMAAAIHAPGCVSFSRSAVTASPSRAEDPGR